MRVVLILGLFCSLLSAQSPSPLALLLDQHIQREKTGLVVVLDGPKGEWKAKLDALLQDPRWMDLDQTPSYYFQKAGEVEAFLQAKYGVGGRPCWIFFGEKGKVIAHGKTPPDLTTLAKAQQEGGIVSETQLLRDFCRTHPDHLDGVERLLNQLNNKANQKTKTLIGKKLRPLRPADVRGDMAQYYREQEERAEAAEKEEREKKTLAQLDAKNDEAIWGEAAALYQKVLRSPDWPLISDSLVPSSSARHSPIMQEICREAFPEVEVTLRRKPYDWRLWELWLALAKVFQGRSLRILLESLIPF